MDTAMDFVSHTLWGYSLFGFRGKPAVALISGAMPDVVSFGPIVVTNMINGNYHHGPPDLSTIPAWTFVAYDCSHSLVCASLAIVIVAKYNTGVAWAMLAWLAHIFLDVPFHTKAYFPTKLFWPLSDFSFDGVSWGNPWVWFTQLALLTALLIYRCWQSKRRTS
ncbi:MAG: hypothetical protein PHI06_13000 [Desulfobulbaceae bacterium]|nr:hypothetical protein [Desulfobulbaceae bacterium]